MRQSGTESTDALLQMFTDVGAILLYGPLAGCAVGALIWIQCCGASYVSNSFDLAILERRRTSQRPRKIFKSK